MILASCLLLGCCAYCLLAITGAAQHLRSRPTALAPGQCTPISILKPLSGLDEGLEANLRSYFEAEYDQFELLFAVRTALDPAVPVVNRLIAAYPHVTARLLITGEPPYAHAKVYSLHCMLEQAQYELIAMCDSDVRVGPDFCRHLSGEFQDPALGMVTCPYRAVAGRSFWSQLEALGMNTDFHAGLFTAVLLEGAKFAVGPTIVARKAVLHRLGGLERVKDYLAEDFMLGRLASELGCGVRFSSYVVEHRIGSENLSHNFAHRLRWARSSRRSRPAGYIGQFFTYTLPVGLLALSFALQLWPLFTIAAILRLLSAFSVSHLILKQRVQWLLLPLQDTLAFGFWVAGFFGNSIQWRGQRYTLHRDGTIELAG